MLNEHKLITIKRNASFSGRDLKTENKLSIRLGLKHTPEVEILKENEHSSPYLPSQPSTTSEPFSDKSTSPEAGNMSP